MTLTHRILLLFGLLLAVMLVAAGWGSQWLARELSAELDEVAVSVGQSVISVIDEVNVKGAEAVQGPEVVVERIITSNNQTIRATHRQAGDRITNLSIQVNDQPVQVVDVPLHLLTGEGLESIHIEAMAQSLAKGELRLTGHRLQRDIPVNRTGVADAMGRYVRRISVGLAVLFGLGMLGALIIARRVGRPLSQLQDAARRMGDGSLGLQVDGASSVAEVDETIDAFNRMSSQLKTLEETRVQLQARSHLSELGEIGRGLAHSLRNPLNTIGLSIEQLAARHDDPDSRRLAAQARSQIQRIDESIRGFLTLASAAHAIAEPVDVVATVRDVMLEALQRGGGCTIDVQAPQSLNVEGVATEIRAMIQSLIVNAIEAGESQRIEVTISGTAEAAQIEVGDRGKGIDIDVLPRLFEPHVTTKPDGSGMGLYLTRRLAESQYGGSVTLAPRAGGGAMATLRLGPRIAHD